MDRTLEGQHYSNYKIGKGQNSNFFKFIDQNRT